MKKGQSFGITAPVVLAAVLAVSLAFIGCAGDAGGNDPAGDPALTGTVTITGTAEAGQTLTADTTALGGTGTISYRWKAGTKNITGETGSTYSPVTGDVGKTITVEVSRAGYSGTVTSAATSAVAAAGSLALTGTVTITGIPEVGETLTAVTSALGGTTGAISYRWKADAADISGATGSTYSPAAGDIGKAITVEVSRAGYSGSVTGGPTAAVRAAPTTPSGTVQWAKSVTGGTGSSYFYAVAKDNAGNMYAVGYQNGNGGYTYGPGITATGTAYSNDNAVLVKYDSSGAAQWAKSVTAGTVSSSFVSVALDSSGNVYAAGYQNSGTVKYGSTAATEVTTTDTGVVLVKYDSSGDAQWAKSVTGSDRSYFFAVAVDSVGDVYAAGYQYGNTAYNYGNGKTAMSTGTSANGVLVKYNPGTGDAQWAQTVDTTGGSSNFSALAVDNSNNVYAAGYQGGTGSFTYGTGVSVTGASTGTAVLVKYDPGSGNALWAKTVTGGADSSIFNAVAVDSAGNVYAAGKQNGNGPYNYGGSATATTGAASGTYDGNAVLVKYDSTGAAQWAKSTTAGAADSNFNSVAVDSAGNVYAAGYQRGGGAYDYGSGTVTGAASGTYDDNAVLVKYNSAGTVQWAKSVTTGAADSSFKSVAADNLGGVYAAGDQKDNSAYDYGDSQSATGGTAISPNAVLVKYQR